MNDAENVPLKRYDIPSRRRVVFQAHYSCLGPEKAARIRESGKLWPNGGLMSPRWQVDYELSLTASAGTTVCPNYDDVENVKALPIDPNWKHVLSFDFGASTSSYMTATATALGPKYNYTYWEYVGAGLPVRIHKGRMRDALRLVRPGLDYEFDWGLNYAAIGDVTGVGYKVEYADTPWPLKIVAPSSATGWRDRDESESMLNGYFDVAKRCCFRQYEAVAESCDVCKAKLEFSRGWYLHPRCENARAQIQSQIVPEEGARKKEGRDVFDTLMYAARYAMTTKPRLQRELEKADAPWWLQGEKVEENASTGAKAWVQGKDVWYDSWL